MPKKVGFAGTPRNGFLRSKSTDRKRSAANPCRALVRFCKRADRQAVCGCRIAARFVTEVTRENKAQVGRIAGAVWRGRRFFFFQLAARLAATVLDSGRRRAGRVVLHRRARNPCRDARLPRNGFRDCESTDRKRSGPSPGACLCLVRFFVSGRASVQEQEDLLVLQLDQLRKVFGRAGLRHHHGDADSRVMPA